jgi:hypothetical protein
MKEAESPKPPKKYTIGQRVTVNGWTRSAKGTIKDIGWTFHNRTGEYCWGYQVLFDNNDSPLTMILIPEGYLGREEN